MKKSLIISIVGILFTLISCSSQKIIKNQNLIVNPPFKILKANYTTWAKEEPQLKGVTIVLQIDNDKIHLETIYLNEMKEKFSLKMNTQNIVYVASFVLPRQEKDYNLNANPKNEFGNEPPSTTLKKTVDLENTQIVVSYKYNNKMYFYKINKLQESE